MKRTYLLAGIVSVLLLAACSPAGAGEPALTVEASALKYQPATLQVTAGKPVMLTFHNKDSVEHDFSIVEFPMASMSGAEEAAGGHDMSGMAQPPDLHVAASIGGSASIEFTPSKPGTYEFFCTVPGHKEAGMVGTLIVEAP